MADYLEVLTQPEYSSDEEDEQMVCRCGHTFERQEVDEVCRIVITEETLEANGGSIEISCDSDGDIEERDALSEYLVTLNECPHCSDCTIENGKITLAPVVEYMCKTCLETYYDSDDAYNCCESG